MGTRIAPRRLGLRRMAAGLRRLATDRHYRAVKILAHFGRPGLFQPYNTTRENRYPRLFAFLRQALAGRGELRILSFGCATGEEVFTLRGYFPQAVIKGIDINPANIATAEARLARAPDPGLGFACGASAADEPAEAYDMILCLAVLRDGRLGGRVPPRCDHRIRFADFERMVAEFAAALKPGGLLAIRFSNFRFGDTASAPAFRTVLSLPLSETAARDTPLYDRDNRLIAGAVYEDCVFIKRPTA